ncbi:MAG: single-stranded DNA-binding protein [Armatimonadota bacterium]
MVNSVVLVGRLTADPEMRYTPNGVAVTNFRLAVDRRPRRDQPREERQADFIDIVAWRQTAEFCGNYLNKGALVSVEGRIQVRDWETQDGQRRRNVEVVAYSVQSLESRAERERRQQAAGGGGEGQPPPSEDEAPAPAGDPFVDE